MSATIARTEPDSAALPLVQMAGIAKRFGGVTVLQEVQFEVRAGEVHVLAGENGAGKSTLVRILGGIHTDFDGRIEISGREVRPRTPLEANRLGVAVIHQELSLIGPMSVADNIFLGRTGAMRSASGGREPGRADLPVGLVARQRAPARFVSGILALAGLVSDARQQEAATYWVRQLGLDIDVRRPVEQFPIAVRQVIEIAKALSQNALVMVMDEPTSALNAPEVERLFALIGSLRQRGCGIVYISHKMEEIERIADRITVLRDGRWIGTAPARELPRPKFMQWLVGRDLGEQFPRRKPHPGGDRLRLENFSVFPGGFSGKAAAHNVSLSVRSGEILGLGGLQGSGASELLLGLSGAYGAATRGRAWLDGKAIRFDSPRQAIEAGVALLTNDRKATGLILPLSITANVTLAALRELSPAGWRRPARERAAAEKATARMQLRARSLEAEAGTLSGGNQQKVAIAKWLQTRPRLLLLDEPTRGIDIAAKREIYQLIDEWTAQGIAIVLITSEMPELLRLSDRIVVLHRGQVTAEFAREQAAPETVLAAAMGRTHPEPGPDRWKL